jgi:hypothetical protein
MSARIQTWLPFRIQICVNGREWLARSMDAAGLHYVQRDNCFTWLENPTQAQRLMDQQLRSDWPALLTEIARSLNPLHETMFAAFSVEYYWSTYQSEWATDILFRHPALLGRLYPRLVQHSLTIFFSPDVMRFLGRKVPPSGNLPPRLEPEVVSDVKRRPDGVRIKPRVGDHSVKMYDKQGSVLRVETAINDVTDFKTFRAPENKPDAEPGWQRMRKGIADLHRRAEVSQAANDRYLRALASVEDTTSLGELTVRLCQPARHKGPRIRPPNPHAPADAALLTAICHGEFAINGLRNREPAPTAVHQCPCLEGRAEASSRCGVAQADAAARTSPDPRGPTQTPLSTDQSRPHRPDRRTQRQHAGTDEIGGLRKSSQFAGIFKVSIADAG